MALQGDLVSQEEYRWIGNDNDNEPGLLSGYDTSRR